MRGVLIDIRGIDWFHPNAIAIVATIAAENDPCCGV